MVVKSLTNANDTSAIAISMEAPDANFNPVIVNSLSDDKLVNRNDENKPFGSVDIGEGSLLSDEIVESAFFRLTAGLPRRELRSVVQEATECEALLLAEIKTLEFALKYDTTSTSDPENTDDALNQLLDTPITPLDRFLTLSALIGRLRQDFILPSPLAGNSTPCEIHSVLNEERTIEEVTGISSPLIETYNKIMSSDALLAVWRKISSNRVAFVFKRPVKSEEAPGYTDRILFPMDLSLIRKRIITGNIQTFKDLHMALGLISHNCVKYNGRETDYGRVARDFEAMVDSVIVQAVQYAATNPSAEPSSETDDMILKTETDNRETGILSKTKASPNDPAKSESNVAVFSSQETGSAKETTDTTNSSS